MAGTTPSGADAPAKPSSSAGDVIDFKWVVEKCALPLALVLLPVIYQSMAAIEAENARTKAATQAQRSSAEQARKDQADQKFQLYTNLLSRREEADTTVRRGLFDKLIGTYFEANPQDPYKKLVQLELLALNFHDALNLNPLFWELHRLIERMPQGARRADLRDQLDRVAKQVKDRQVALLEVDGFPERIEVPLAFLVSGGSWSMTINKPQLGDAAVQGSRALHEFTLSILEKDAKNRRLFVMVGSQALKQPIGFWVDPFDFPLSNFIRISPTERVAIILESYDDPKGIARLLLLYFPSSRSAAKDKPYIDDLMIKLLPPPSEVTASAALGAGGTGK